MSARLSDRLAAITCVLRAPNRSAKRYSQNPVSGRNFIEYYRLITPPPKYVCLKGSKANAPAPQRGGGALCRVVNKANNPHAKKITALMSSAKGVPAKRSFVGKKPETEALFLTVHARSRLTVCFIAERYASTKSGGIVRHQARQRILRFYRSFDV